MAIIFNCSTCLKQLQVSDQAAGRSSKCPYCKGPITVPRSLAVAEGRPPAAARVPSPVAVASPPAGLQRVGAGLKRFWPWAYIAAGGAALAVLLAVAVVWLFSRPGSPKDADYHDAENHFSLRRLPSGWGGVPADALESVNKLVSESMPGSKIKYTAGFQLAKQPPLSYPYVLVQPTRFQTRSTASYDEIEENLAKETKTAIKKVEGAFPELKDLAVGVPALDRSRNRIITRIEMDVPGIGKVKGLSVGFIGANGIINVHCYAPEADFDRQLPPFHALLESFQFDSGYTFTPRGGLGSAVVIGAVCGGIIGGLAVVVLPLVLPRKSCPACAKLLPRYHWRDKWLSGFWSCPNCGCKLDRNRRAVPPIAAK